MALRTLDGSLGVAIINLLGEGADHEPDPEGTFLLPSAEDIFIALQQKERKEGGLWSQLTLISKAPAGECSGASRRHSQSQSPAPVTIGIPRRQQRMDAAAEQPDPAPGSKEREPVDFFLPVSTHLLQASPGEAGTETSRLPGQQQREESANIPAHRAGSPLAGETSIILRRL